MANLSEENFDEFLVELQYSPLIVPVTEYTGAPIVEDNMPLFTDLYEFHKFNDGKEFIPITHHFNYYLELIINKMAEWFIINPNSERYAISKGILEYMRPNYIFDQEYRVFTTKEIHQINELIDNMDLNEFLSDKSIYNGFSWSSISGH